MIHVIYDWVITVSSLACYYILPGNCSAVSGFETRKRVVTIHRYRYIEIPKECKGVGLVDDAW